MKIKKIGIDGDEEHIGFNCQEGRISVPKQMKSEKELILTAIIMNTHILT